MPLIQRKVGPVKVSSGKLQLKGKADSEFIAVNNETLANVLRQLASVVTHAGDIFSDVATLTEQVGKRVRSVKLRLDELEAKADLFDPRLVPVPEGTLDDISNACTLHHRLHGGEHNEEQVRIQTTDLIRKETRPRFLIQLYENAGNHDPVFPPRSPVLSSRRSLERQISADSRRPASFAALRDWKLDDYLDEKIATLDRKKQSADALNRALASPFPSKVVQVDVTGAGFDRMKANRRSLVVHTKRIRTKKRRNTICGSLPNKECGIQTSLTSVTSPGGTGDEDGTTTSGEHRHHSSDDRQRKKYGIDSGHWSSSCTSSAQGVPGGVGGSTCSAPSPWDPNSLSTSSDFLFDEEDRCLTPQLENFTDGLVSDSDSVDTVDTDGYFTSFRSDCGFPRVKKSASTKELEDLTISNKNGADEILVNGDVKPNGDKLNETGGTEDGSVIVMMNGTSADSSANNTIISTGFNINDSTGSNNTRSRISITENEYELFGKGSTSTTASSCGTVVLRSKPDPPARTTSTTVITAAGVDTGEEQKGPSCESSCGNEDVGLVERVKRKSLIELVPSIVVVTPSPSCSSGSPPPLKDPGTALHLADSCTSAAEDSDSGRLTPKADDLFTTNESECGTLSDTDSDRRTEVRLSDIAMKKRSTGSSTSSTGTASTSNSTLTLTSCPLNGNNSGGLPQPDVIPAEAVVQQLQLIRTNKATPRLDANKEYYSLDTVLLGSSEEELRRQNGGIKKNDEKQDGISNNHDQANLTNGNSSKTVKETRSPSPNAPASNGPATSGKVRGARVVLDANGEIIFSSETLRRKRKQKVSFDPGAAVKSPDYDSTSTYSRVRESVYDRIKKPTGDPEKLYECIEEIRRHNLKQRDPFLDVQEMKQNQGSNNNGDNGKGEGERSASSASSTLSSSSPSKSCSTPDHMNGLLETDLDSAIPPVMPDLKNLPKIKDRLKRNESYRIANTDDVPQSNGSNPRAGSPSPGKPKIGKINGNRSPLSPLHLNRNGLTSLTKRMSLTSPPSTSPTPLHLNKKRDIPEEDPNFIQQMFTLNTAANNQLQNNVINGGTPNNNGSNSGTSSPFNHHNLLKSPQESSRVTPSKFTLSMEDRPSFLRRDSPPTMDEIAKEIYRFRKKFNIQPNAATSTLTSPVQTSNTMESGVGNPFVKTGSLRGRPVPRSSSSIGHYPNYTASLPRSATTSGIGIKSTIPAGFPTLCKEPSPPPRQIATATVPSPPSFTSTPLRRPFSYALSPSSPNPVPGTPSPIYYPSYPSYGWGSPSPPKCSTPLRNGIEHRIPTSSATLDRSYKSSNPTMSSTPPIPPARNFGAGRKIFPMMRPMSSQSNSVSGSSTPTSVHSLNYSNQNQYHSATVSEPIRYSASISNKSSSSSGSSPVNNNNNYSLNNGKLPNGSNNASFRKSLLPSLPFRRNSVAFAESSSPLTPSPFSRSPRTSINEFKKLLQASQKKKASISAVEVLKPKGLETTI